MKNLLLIVLIFISCFSYGETPNAIKISQVIDSTGSYITRDIPPPPADGLLGYDYFTNRPIWALVSAVPITSGQISDTSSASRSIMTAPNMSAIQTMLAVPTKTTDLTNNSGYVITSDSRLSDSRVPTAHSHPSSAITDFNSASDARVVSGITGKENTIPTGTASQYYRGDKTWQSMPSIPAAQVNSDWSSSSGISQILNKPTIQSIQRIRVQTNSTGDYTWTYPTPYASGVIPVLSAVSESASTTIPQGVQIVGVPTNTSATFKVINLPSTSVLSIIVLGAPTASQAYIHLTAVAP